MDQALDDNVCTSCNHGIGLACGGQDARHRFTGSYSFEEVVEVALHMHLSTHVLADLDKLPWMELTVFSGHEPVDDVVLGSLFEVVEADQLLEIAKVHQFVNDTLQTWAACVCGIHGDSKYGSKHLQRQQRFTASAASSQNT